jgi:phage terminase large subunit-like protein
MAKRLTTQQLVQRQAPRAITDARRVQMASSFVFGQPMRPQGKERQWRETWTKLAAELLSVRKLAKSDGAKLAALTDALRASRIGTPAEKESSRLEYEALRAEFDSRTPFPEPKPEPKVERPEDVPALVDFIESVKRCRESFSERMVPGEVLTQDEGGQPYLFPEGDAATVARQYARDVVFGKIVSGKLEIAACERFLKNLETGGKERGFFFDPLEARLVVNFFKFYCGFELLPWQVLVAVDLMCWKKPTGYRLRVKLFLSIGRKNGKTFWCGSLSLFCLLCDQEKFAELYSFAMTKDQSRICWKDAKRIVKASPELSSYVKAQQHALLVDDTDSCFVPLSADSDTADGLRCSLGIGDEFEMWKSDELVDKIITSQLSRKQPLLILAGTAGKSKDEGYAWTQTEIFVRLLTGVTQDDAVFDSVAVHIFRLDDDDDIIEERNWHKANPSGSATQDWEQLRRLVGNLRVDQNFKYKWRRDICNMWNDSMDTGGTLPANLVNACLGYEGMPSDVRKLREWLLQEAAQHRNEPRFRFTGGADAGGVDDFFSLSLVLPAFSFPSQEPKTVVLNWYWMKSENLDERGKRLNAPLRRWVDEGHIALAGERFVDRMKVYNDIVEICTKYKVVELGWDPYRADDYMQTLHKEHGIIGTLVPQQTKVLTTACQTFARAVLDKKIVFTDPVMTMMARNVDFTPDKWGGIRPLKPKSEQGDTKDERMKIDGVSSCVNAIQRIQNIDPKLAGFQKLEDRLSQAADDRKAGREPENILFIDAPWLNSK